MREKLLLLVICLSGVFYSNAQHGLAIDHLKFIENKGQWNENIRFRADIPSGELILQKDYVGYVLWDEEEYAAASSHRHDHFLDDSLHEDEIPEITYQAFKVKFVDINESVIRGINPESFNRNYLKGKDPEKWATNVKAYTEIEYLNVFEGIDFSLFASDRSLKYEFEVTPKSDPSQIILEYEGVDELRIEDGRLVIQTSVGTIKEKQPYAYQIIKGKEVEVECDFKVDGNVLSFELGKYKSKYPLIIDPQLIFSTYSGSTADNWGNTACLDNRGNLYTGGTIFPTTRGGTGASDLDGFPATNGAFQTTFQGGDTDIGILKFDSSGKYLQYATYIGGDDAEIPTSTITNDKGELYILGVTGSTNFPRTSSGFQPVFAGGTSVVPVGGYAFLNGTDNFILKLNKDGSNIEYATYLGGSSNDGLNFRTSINYGDQLRGDINIDTSGYVYFTSITNSSDYPTKNAFKSNLSGISDAVVAKLNPDLSELEFCTYLGGSSDDAGMSIIRDDSNNVVVTGGTFSMLDFPVTDTIKAYEGGSNLDAFISVFSSDGTQLKKSIRFGTTGHDQGYFVQKDISGSLYVLGQCLGGNYKASNGVYSIPQGGIFIHKFDKNLDSTVWVTTIGDTIMKPFAIPNISPTAFLVNECGNLFISGWGGETNLEWNLGSLGRRRGYTYNLPVTDNAYSKNSDSSDFYMMVLEREAQSLIYATYFGGADSKEHVDGGTSRFDKQGIVYQSVCAGCGNNDDFPLFPSPDGNPDTYPQYNNSANCNNGVFKYDLANLKAQFTAEQICDSLVAVFQNTTVGGVDFYWDFGDGHDTVTYNPVTVKHEYENPGLYTVKLIATDLTTCIGKDSMLFNLDLREAFVGKAFQDTICQGDSIQIKASETNPSFTYNWYPKENILNDQSSTPTVFPDSTKSYYVDITDDRGCLKTDTFTVYTTLLLDSIKYMQIGSCSGLPNIQFQTKYEVDPGINYQWNMGDGTEFDVPEPKYKYKSEGKYLVTLEVTNSYCYFKDTSSITIQEVYVPNIFTPNGDGKNDLLEILGIEGNGNWKLEIYNRWGKSVFVDETYQNQWTGGDLEDTTYYYLLTSPDGTTCKGWIQIVR